MLARRPFSPKKSLTRASDSYAPHRRDVFVLEASYEVVACGGWSRRDRLYGGSGESIGDGRLLDPVAEPAKVRAVFVRDDWNRHGLGRRIL
jgi:hypothetical protein